MTEPDLWVGAGAAELSGGRPVGQIPVQMVIQEFGTIIAIEAEHGKRQRGFNILICAVTPSAPLFQVARFSVQPDKMG